MAKIYEFPEMVEFQIPAAVYDLWAARCGYDWDAMTAYLVEAIEAQLAAESSEELEHEPEDSGSS